MTDDFPGERAALAGGAVHDRVADAAEGLGRESVGEDEGAGGAEPADREHRGGGGGHGTGVEGECRLARVMRRAR